MTAVDAPVRSGPRRGTGRRLGRHVGTMPSAARSTAKGMSGPTPTTAGVDARLRIQDAFSALGAHRSPMRYAIALVAISLTAAALAAGGFGSMADDGPAPQTGAVSSQRRCASRAACPPPTCARRSASGG